MFYGEKLEELRELDGLSRKELSQKLKVTEQTIGQYENSQVTPRIDILKKLERLFNVRLNFFMTPSFLKKDSICDESIAFRSNDRDSRKKAKLELMYLSFVNYFISYLESFIQEKNNSFYELENKVKRYQLTHQILDIEKIANISRTYLHIDDNKNLMFRLENSGINILEKDLGLTTDAYSGYTKTNAAFIILGNIKKSAVRRNFDLAHELGHLLLHSELDLSTLDTKEHNQVEHEANKFAACLLMPKQEFVKDFALLSRPTNPNSYINLKKKYHVSIAAMGLRARDLNLITYQQSRYFWALMNKYHYRIDEPLDNKIVPIRPGKIKYILQLLLNKNIINVHDLTDTFHVNSNFFIKLFNLTDNFFEKYSYSSDMTKENKKIIDLSQFIKSKRQNLANK